MIKTLCAVAGLSAMFLASTVTHAFDDATRATVTVPADASGGFGSPASGNVPLVKAKTVKHAGTITIKYVTGTWCFGSTPDACGVGPNGIEFPQGGTGNILPLEEVTGLPGGNVTNLAALTGAFVPESLVNTLGFQALDGTKLTSELLA